jgi:NAD(P)H-nitrite reductase large subunit
MADEDHLKKAALLARVVCICKGINLAQVLRGLPGSDSVADVNRKTGTGCGGCQGERCGPRIKVLLKKFKEKSS